jgi:hypothetical protein
MPGVQALAVSHEGFQYLGKLTKISKPVTDEDGNVSYTVTARAFGDHTGLHRYTETNHFGLLADDWCVWNNRNQGSHIPAKSKSVVRLRQNNRCMCRDPAACGGAIDEYNHVVNVKSLRIERAQANDPASFRCPAGDDVVSDQLQIQPTTRQSPP